MCVYNFNSEGTIIYQSFKTVHMACFKYIFGFLWLLCYLVSKGDIHSGHNIRNIIIIIIKGWNKKIWYFYFWKWDWILGWVSYKLWNFPNFRDATSVWSFFHKISSFVWLWWIKTALKFCKVLNYFFLNRNIGK